MKRIGILGGTFDPPHLGHLLIAEEVKNQLGLAGVWFIPTYDPPHKQRAKTSAVNRLDMLQQAIATNDQFAVNTIEMDRLGKSYTFDTMFHLKKEHPDTQFYFIIGADMVESLAKWHRIYELIDMVQFVGVGRTGFTLDTDYMIKTLQIPMFDISSSQIRERIQCNQSIKYLLPDRVESYIKRKRLYE